MPRPTQTRERTAMRSREAILLERKQLRAGTNRTDAAEVKNGQLCDVLCLLESLRVSPHPSLIEFYSNPKMVADSGKVRF